MQSVFLITIYISPRDTPSDCVTVPVSRAAVNNFEKLNHELANFRPFLGEQRVFFFCQ